MNSKLSYRTRCKKANCAFWARDTAFKCGTLLSQCPDLGFVYTSAFLRRLVVKKVIALESSLFARFVTETGHGPSYVRGNPRRSGDALLGSVIPGVSFDGRRHVLLFTNIAAPFDDTVRQQILHELAQGMFAGDEPAFPWERLEENCFGTQSPVHHPQWAGTKVSLILVYLEHLIQAAFQRSYCQTAADFAQWQQRWQPVLTEGQAELARSGLAQLTERAPQVLQLLQPSQTLTVDVALCADVLQVVLLPRVSKVKIHANMVWVETKTNVECQLHPTGRVPSNTVNPWHAERLQACQSACATFVTDVLTTHFKPLLDSVQWIFAMSVYLNTMRVAGAAPNLGPNPDRKGPAVSRLPHATPAISSGVQLLVTKPIDLKPSRRMLAAIANSRAGLAALPSGGGCQVPPRRLSYPACFVLAIDYTPQSPSAVMPVSPTFSVEVLGWGPVHMAATGDLVRLRQLVLENGGVVHHVTGSGMTPLACACAFGQTDAVQVLRSSGALLNVPDYNGLPPLFHAIRSGRVDTVQALCAGPAAPSVSPITLIQDLRRQLAETLVNIGDAARCDDPMREIGERLSASMRALDAQLQATADPSHTFHDDRRILHEALAVVAARFHAMMDHHAFAATPTEAETLAGLEAIVKSLDLADLARDRRNLSQQTVGIGIVVNWFFGYVTLGFTIRSTFWALDTVSQTHFTNLNGAEFDAPFFQKYVEKVLGGIGRYAMGQKNELTTDQVSVMALTIYGFLVLGAIYPINGLVNLREAARLRREHPLGPSVNTEKLVRIRQDLLRFVELYLPNKYPEIARQLSAIQEAVWGRALRHMGSLLDVVAVASGSQVDVFYRMPSGEDALWLAAQDDPVMFGCVLDHVVASGQVGRLDWERRYGPELKSLLAGLVGHRNLPGICRLLDMGCPIDDTGAQTALDAGSVDVITLFLNHGWDPRQMKPKPQPTRNAVEQDLTALYRSLGLAQSIMESNALAFPIATRLRQQPTASQAPTVSSLGEEILPVLHWIVVERPLLESDQTRLADILPRVFHDPARVADQPVLFELLRLLLYVHPKLSLRILTALHGLPALDRQFASVVLRKAATLRLSPEEALSFYWVQKQLGWNLMSAQWKSNDDGVSLLHQACAEDDAGMVQLLLAEGADPNGADATGRTPLRVVPFGATTASLALLLTAGARQTSDQDGVTPLRLAIQAGSEAAARLLISNATLPDLTGVDEKGESLFHHLARSSLTGLLPDIIQRFAQLQGTVDAVLHLPNQSGMAPLDLPDCQACWQSPLRTLGARVSTTTDIANHKLSFLLKGFGIQVTPNVSESQAAFGERALRCVIAARGVGAARDVDASRHVDAVVALHQSWQVLFQNLLATGEYPIVLVLATQDPAFLDIILSQFGRLLVSQPYFSTPAFFAACAQASTEGTLRLLEEWLYQRFGTAKPDSRQWEAFLAQLKLPRALNGAVSRLYTDFKQRMQFLAAMRAAPELNSINQRLTLYGLRSGDLFVNGFNLRQQTQVRDTLIELALAHPRAVPKRPDGSTIFHWLAVYCDLVYYQLKDLAKHFDINVKRADGQTALHVVLARKTISRSDEILIMGLIEAGASLDIPDGAGKTARAIIAERHLDSVLFQAKHARHSGLCGIIPRKYKTYEE